MTCNASLVISDPFSDLSSYYNAPLTENWHPGAGSSDLAEVPRGVQKLAGVDFDLRGLIQVGSASRGGAPYRKEVSGIPIKLACKRLHFVHSAIMAYALPLGTEIGRYRVHYTDGQTREIPIVLGRDVADWFSQANENFPDLDVAWSGENEASRSAGRTIRLFKSTWQNPVPELAIKSLDFVSNHDRAAPFLVAITAE